MKMRFDICYVSLLALCLTGCGTVKEQLGLTRHTPDEFSVMQRAPLEIPTDMTSLPVPAPGAPRPQDVSAKEQAKQVILGDAVNAPGDESSKAENALLKKAGATNVNPDIRRQLALDAKVQSKDSRPVVKRLLNMGDDEPVSSVVDPAAEAERIKKAKEAGQPITTGETPTKDE